MYKNYLKPIIDILFSFLMLIMLLPLFILITIVLIFTNRGNPFFIQVRPGKNEKNFKLIKFKTMGDFKDSDGNLLSDRKRLTKIGKILRKYSLDEIPQIINILKGELSLIGPRPLRKYYLPLYNDFQKRRHEIKPGITGWAQVNGRNALTWERKFQMDVWYVDNLTFKIDLKIMWLTILRIIKKENVLEPDGFYTSPFRGTGDKMISEEEVKILRNLENQL